MKYIKVIQNERVLDLRKKIDDLKQKLAKYENIGEPEELVKLPCKVGDTICKFNNNNSITSDVVIRIVISKKDITIYTKKNFYPIKLSEYDVLLLPSSINCIAYCDFYVCTLVEAEAMLKKTEE